MYKRNTPPRGGEKQQSGEKTGGPENTKRTMAARPKWKAVALDRLSWRGAGQAKTVVYHPRHQQQAAGRKILHPNEPMAFLFL